VGTMYYYNDNWQVLAEYDAYGKTTILSSAYSVLSSAQYGNPYFFTGRRLDVLDNGNLLIYHHRHRTYDTYTARFLQHDPLEYADGLNRYEYVRGAPTQLGDPYGLYPWDNKWGLGKGEFNLSACTAYCFGKAFGIDITDSVFQMFVDRLESEINGIAQDFVLEQILKKSGTELFKELGLPWWKWCKRFLNSAKLTACLHQCGIEYLFADNDANSGYDCEDLDPWTGKCMLDDDADVPSKVKSPMTDPDIPPRKQIYDWGP